MFGSLDPVTHLPTQVDNQPYVYDAIGNILSKAGITYSYNDAMHPSFVTGRSDGKTYTADANGNTASGGGRSFSWTPDNRVGSVTMNSSTTSMDYDYTGARVKKDGPLGVTIYPFPGYEVDPNGTKIKFFKSGNETLASKQWKTTGEKIKYFYHNDHLGGVKIITDDVGAHNGARQQINEYDPWGKVSRNEGINAEAERRFTGQILDAESGLYYYGARYYDPELARFISPDSIVPSAGDPQSLNRYSYTRNNPVKYIDPTGHSFWSALGNFFKNLFRHPEVFIATLVVGLVTGGLAYAYLAPALGLAAGSWGAIAVAGAVGGAFAGLTNAGMTGGNLWQGFLMGGIAGAIGGAVGCYVGCAIVNGALEVSFTGVVAGAFAGGFVSGALGTAFNGGNFFQNAMVGAIGSTVVAAAIYGVVQGAKQLHQKWNSMGGTPEGQQSTAGLRFAAAAGSGDTMNDACTVCGERKVPNVVFGIDSPVGGVQSTIPFGSGGEITSQQRGPSYNVPVGPGSNLSIRPAVDPINHASFIITSVSTPIGGFSLTLNISDFSLRGTILGPAWNVPVGPGVNAYIRPAVPLDAGATFATVHE